ncbi:MAG: hypothetical protein P1P88_12990 [Bacteroidales bacterium]|nr:hypothetical protein [Bacteroidales bacterium]
MNYMCGNVSEGLGNPLQYKYLFLNDKGLESLPPGLSAYKNCLKILAPNNQLTEIPEEIGELSKLEMLHLDSNHLSALPASLVNCANLHLLYLEKNRFTVLPEWLSDLKKMKDFFVHKNQLRQLPLGLGNMKDLQHFGCSYNSISTLPESMVNCTKLETINLQTNKFAKFPEQLRSMPNLYRINLAYNPLSELPEWLPELTELKYLTLSHCNFKAFPEIVLQCPNLEELRIESNQFKNILISDKLFPLRLYIKGNPLRYKNRLELMGNAEKFRYLSYNAVTEKKKLQYAQKAAWYFRGIRYKLNKELLKKGIVYEEQRIFTNDFFDSLDTNLFTDIKWMEISKLVEAFKQQINNLQILGYETIEEIENLECPVGLVDDLYKTQP